MNPNIERLIQNRSDAVRAPREREIVQMLRRNYQAGMLDDRRRAARAEVARLIAAVRADARDPFRDRTDEEIAGELLRRLTRP